MTHILVYVYLLARLTSICKTHNEELNSLEEAKDPDRILNFYLESRSLINSFNQIYSVPILVFLCSNFVLFVFIFNMKGHDIIVQIATFIYTGYFLLQMFLIFLSGEHFKNATSEYFDILLTQNPMLSNPQTRYLAISLDVLKPRLCVYAGNYLELNLGTFFTSICFNDESSGDKAPSIRTVFNWFNEFKLGKINLEDEPRSGRPPTTIRSNNYVSAVREKCGHWIGSNQDIINDNLK
ncbi:hypothetical protein LAZ67_1004275 [Cordylochernes scorpioides]|uniref:Uncharacterized protein n=1 Tax=Cordylochernes scorpioides TaxID=51811 RepID=A0ABY6JXD0_9ARAC|nr:hypothetical protein LAZ67_1004275 [Cordylochernes scorpioides]